MGQTITNAINRALVHFCHVDYCLGIVCKRRCWAYLIFLFKINHVISTDPCRLGRLFKIITSLLWLADGFFSITTLVQSIIFYSVHAWSSIYNFVHFLNFTFCAVVVWIFQWTKDQIDAMCKQQVHIFFLLRRASGKLLHLPPSRLRP